MYEIKNIKNKDGSISQWAYRIGRVGFVDFLNEGMPLIFVYPNEKFFNTSIIQNITKSEGSKEIVIETKNTIYVLEDIGE